MDTILRISAVCLIIPSISAGILGLTSPPGPINKCETDDCKANRLETAALILKYRDETAQPCDNIYQHVCGNYEKTDMTHNFDYIESKRNVVKDKMIGEEMEWIDESIVYKLIHDFYMVCMDDKARDKALETVKENVKALGGWPIVEGDNWKDADFNWIDLIGKFKKIGYNINFLVDWVPKKLVGDEKSYLAFNLKMAPSYFDKGIDLDVVWKLEIYEDLIFRIVRDFGAAEEKARKGIAAAVEFETSLYNISKTEDTFRVMTIEELQKEYPSIDWTKFIEKTLTPFLDPEDKSILTIDNPDALKKLLDLMEKTPKNVIANYGIWKIIQFSLPYLAGSYPQLVHEFREITGAPEIPREAFCDEMTTHYTDLAVARMYLDHFESSKDAIANMFSVLKEKMIEMVKESKLSDDEKKQGVELLTAMEYTIGESDKLSHLHELEKYYEDAEVKMDNFLQTVLNMEKFKMKKEFSNKLRADEFQFSPRELNISGVPQNFKNHMYIPMTTIPNLMFDINLPMYLNFGAAGSIMAMEMFKSVAHLGKKFGEDGKEIPNDQHKCFLVMGDNITDPAIKQGFVEVLADEIMAHYIGFQVSYKAYQQYVTESGPELPLAEVPYTVEQLFWMSWNQVFCFAREEDLQRPKPVEGLDLSVMDFITMLMMNNVPQIAEDFKCPVGSLMNPDKKCTWW